MAYTFESYNTELTGGELKLPDELFDTPTGAVVVFPSPYMTVRISDEEHFHDIVESMDRLPAKHRQMVLRLIHGKAVSVKSANVTEAVYFLMRELYTDSAALFKGNDPIPVRVENCGDYVQLTVRDKLDVQ